MHSSGNDGGIVAGEWGVLLLLCLIIRPDWAKGQRDDRGKWIQSAQRRRRVLSTDANLRLVCFRAAAAVAAIAALPPPFAQLHRTLTIDRATMALNKSMQHTHTHTSFAITQGGGSGGVVVATSTTLCRSRWDERGVCCCCVYVCNVMVVGGLVGGERGMAIIIIIITMMKKK